LHFFPSVHPEVQWLIITFEMESGGLLHLKDSVKHVSKDFRQLAASCALSYKEEDERDSNLDLIFQFSQLISSFSSKPAENTLQAFEDPKWERAHEILNKVNEFVEANISKDISASAIADDFNLAKNYLGSLFRENFGITLGQYVTNLKIQKATELLLLTDFSMNEVALRSGFDNPISFNRAFKRIMQFPPAKYRTLVKKD
ncbi:MAG: helix-turn-helix transcriptional regulator, partial [Lentisphaeria bacterium]